MATINGSRFTNNQTIAVNGTVGGGGQDIPSSSSGRLYVELRDPNNETVMYDSTNMTTTGGNSKSPFSYRLIAGELEANGSSTTASSSSSSRTVVKPMDVSGLNYTLAVGYKMPQTSASEVQFTFAYDHGDDGGLLGDEPTTVASRFAGNNNTTTATTTTTADEEPVIPTTPRPVLDQPEEEDDDDDDDGNNDDDGSDDDDNGDDDDDSALRIQESGRIIDQSVEEESGVSLRIIQELLDREPPVDIDEEEDDDDDD